LTTHLDARMTSVIERQTLPTPKLAGAIFDTSRTGKLAARVARRIEQDIVHAGWEVGQVFGSETELRHRYGVSRAVLREAIRLVEHHQMGAMRRGPNGGLVVRAPGAGATTSAMMMYLESVGTTLDHLLSVRLLLEPLAVSLAAEHIGESDIAQLRSVLSEEIPYQLGKDAHLCNQVHLTLAELSGNPALSLFIEVLTRLTWRYAGRQLTKSPEPSDPGLERAHQAHQAIVAEVVAGDSARAQYLAQQHLEDLQDYLHSSEPLSRTAGPIGEAVDATPGRDQKLAELLAQRILSEIIEGGWALGTVIGSEATLLDRFEVSRPALREAVRLLEYHSVARMRPGPGGGLVVTKPNPTASIDATALHLQFQGIATDDLRTVREVLELGCADQLAAIADQPQVADRLRPMLDTPQPEGVGLAVPADPRCDRFHIELADLTQNPALALFLRILITLQTRHEDSDAATTPTPTRYFPDRAREVSKADRDIVAALLACDAGLARHRMRRHLQPSGD
jgi:DNA-binding FadR family transcriptional regulator